MNHPFLLAPGQAYSRATSLRFRAHLPQLKFLDPAVRAMSDFLLEPALTVLEQASLTQAFDDMFRLGVRAFLVVRDSSVVGLITAEDIRRSNAPQQQCVAEVMTAAFDVPAIDWQTLQDSRISDLVEIFEGTGVRHLIVLQSEISNLSTVRGWIHRERLERQLAYRADA